MNNKPLGNCIGYIVPAYRSEPPLFLERHPDTDERAVNRNWTLVHKVDEGGRIETDTGIYLIIEKRKPDGGYIVEDITLK